MSNLERILFIRNKKAFLPEINAYTRYFNNIKGFKAFDSSKLEGDYNINEFDIIWEFKGFGGIKSKDKIVIHEYASLSTGSFPLFRNNMKSKLNPKPSFRIFLNKNVREGFKFKDSIDYCYRDMGIDESFINLEHTEKKYDFVYVGSICKARGIDVFLKEYIKAKPGKLCLIGNVEDELYEIYKGNKDITFTGKVSYSEVPKIASKAIYGINFIPDKYPYNIQTSTKLLEYLALGLKIITTDYKWVREFEEKNLCDFYKLNYRNIKIDIDRISKYNFKSNFKAEESIWNKVIEKSGIVEKLRKFI